jgi:glycosyltransferase involved in cell wall biosynthesis
MERHVALFTRSLGRGGAQRTLATLAREFTLRGHRVDVVLARGRGHFLSHLPETVRVIDLGGRSSWRALPVLARRPRDASLLAPFVVGRHRTSTMGCLPALVRYLRRRRPDAMLATLEAPTLAAVWARRVAGVPTRVVVRVANTTSLELGKPARREDRMPRTMAALYPEADGILACSNGVADDLASLIGLPRERIRTVYNPVDTDVDERMQAPPAHPWLTEREVPVVLGVGRLQPQKDFPTLLRAFARLRRERAARLVILGRGPERERLTSLARELGIESDLALPGSVENPYACFARAAAFVLSSAWEGFANVLVEALACGCPVVATDCSGSSEILDGGVYGRLVPVGDDAALARAIAATLDAPHDPEKLRARARDFAAREMADRYLDVLLGESPSD